MKMNANVRSGHFALSCVFALAFSLSCESPTEPPQQLELSVLLGKSEFFVGEPVYLVFKLENTGPDTAWILPFSRAAWFLTADLRNADGTLLPEGGLIVDYLFPPGYRGEPLGPGQRQYELLLVQDYWGLYEAALRDLYFGGSLIPADRYEFRARFSTSLTEHRVVESAPITFTVRPRTASEDTALQVVLRLAAMPWDTAQRSAFVPAFLSDADTRSASDVFFPYVTQSFLIHASVLAGYKPDSATLERLVAKYEAAANAQKDLAGGAYAVGGASWLDRTSAARLTEQLEGSLAGEYAAWVAAWIAEHGDTILTARGAAQVLFQK
jgi:hypothetical protein